MSDSGAATLAREPLRQRPWYRRRPCSTYITRHWRGELSLAVAFWVNNVLLVIPAGLTIAALAVWVSATGDFLRGGSRALLLAWPLVLLFTLWSTVGAWRSASAREAAGGSRLFCRAVRISLALGMFNTVLAAGFEFVPKVPELLRMAGGEDPVGHVSATLSADGQRLLLSGPLGLGDGQRVLELAAGANTLRVVELDSPGGRINESAEIAALVRARGLDTRTVGRCESACPLVHMAGATRELLPGARLGFHRASAGSMNPLVEVLAAHHMLRLYREAGLSERFLERTLATPAKSMWHPARAELIEAGLVSVPELPAAGAARPHGAGAAGAANDNPRP